MINGASRTHRWAQETTYTVTGNTPGLAVRVMQAVNTTCSQWPWRAQSSELQAVGRVKVMFISSWASVPVEEKSFFWVKKGKNPYNYYSLGFEWILKSNPCRTHLSVHRNKTPEEFSGTIAVLSWTLRSAHLAEPPNDNRRGATFSQGLGCQTRSQAVPHWTAWGQVSCYHYCFSICTWLFLFSNYFYIYYYT